jgi:DNA-binding LacI/PurR family transcriptional regulator
VSASPHASDDAEDIVRAVDSLVAHGIDGIVAIAPQDRARDAMHHVGVRVPILTLQGPAEEIDGYGFDQRGAARLATAHLVELGHRVIAHLPGPDGWAEADERRRGYVEELERHGLAPVLGEPGDWTPESGYGSGRDLLRRDDVTAVFAANDEMAIGLLAAAAEAGLRVPDDLSVVGFDDIPSARYLVPPLTTIQQDFGDLGARVVGAMIDEIEHGGPREHPRALGSRLVVRGSTATVTNRLRHASVG